MNSPMFPEVIDNTMLSTYKACPQKFFKTSIQHWKPKEPSVHLHAGKAFASGLEAARRAFYEQDRSSEDSVAMGLTALLREYGDFQCPDDSAKSAARTAGALEYYFTNYPLEHDPATPIILPNGKCGIEFSFLHPLPISHPETGNPLLYSGRMDMLCNFADGIFIEDDKTTSSLGATWAKNWDLRGQFTGYAWGCRESGIKATGVLVRGVSILKTKYDTQQAISYRPEWQVNRWLDETVVILNEMIRAFHSNVYPHDLGDSCSDFGGCAFRQVCMSQNETPWLESHFSHRRWDPVTREEIPL